MPGKRIARRQFLKRNLAATAIAASGLADFQALSQTGSESQIQYRGPLADFEVNDRHLDSLQFSVSSYENIKPAMTFSATSKPSARLWQKRVRRKLTELVGGLQSTRVALQSRVLEKKRFDGYSREKIVFQSRGNLSVFGYLLLPERISGPIPAIVCLPGHGRGCDEIVGIAENGELRETRSGYARNFALQVVEQGYAAFAIEQLAFGCRRDDAARRKGTGASSCQPAAGAALLFGQTMIGWRVWDVMRAIDYLLTRSEVDSSRVATMGISGGGTVSLFSGALDQRIKISVVSGYFNTFRDSILGLSHCIDNYVPGILNYIEMYDLAGLMAPRGLFVESGLRDPIFPIHGSRAAIKKAENIYSTFGSADKFGHEIFDGEHVFYGKGAFEFLKKML
ncbi:MAG TPA: alpha/beta hydrolase family protein [Blastocatellia bacterium]|nr:alpha/beta hydrolase family protein [Blastocatellia bacterium]